jgi:hypothetical protein
MKNSHSHFLLLMFSLITIVSVGLLYVYMYNTVGTSARRAIVAESAVRSQQTSVLQQKNTENMYNETVGDRAKLDKLFIVDTEAVNFIESLERIGIQSGAKIELSSVAADDTNTLKPGATAYIKGHVSATGQWGNVMRALMLAEVLPYQSKIDGVHLNTSSVSDEKIPKNVWHTEFEVSAPLVKAKP